MKPAVGTAGEVAEALLTHFGCCGIWRVDWVYRLLVRVAHESMMPRTRSRFGESMDDEGRVRRLSRHTRPTLGVA